MGRRSTIALLAGTFAAGSCGSAFAELTYGVNAGVGRSDNITRVADEEISETLATAGLTLEWHELRQRLNADVSIDADYVEYLNDTYDGEIVGGLDGTLDFSIIPDRMTWLVQDSFGQESTDPFAPVTPASRENVNYFTTGPTFEFPVGTRAARVFATYSRTDYEESPFDSNRVVGGLAYGPRGPDALGLGINAVTEHVKYKDDANVDFDRQSVYASYSLRGSRTEISAEAGYFWLELEDGEKSGDPRFHFEVERAMSSSSTLSLQVGTQLTDSSDALRSSLFPPDSPGAGASVTATTDPYRNRYAGLSWNFNRHRTSLTLGADWSDDAYETQTQLDLNRMFWSASVTRQATSRLRLGLSGTYSDEEFENSGITNQTTEYGATVEWQAGRVLSLRLSLLRSDRDSDNGIGEYVENRAFLTLIYQTGEARAASGRAR
jgi:hypothetical protein